VSGTRSQFGTTRATVEGVLGPPIRRARGSDLPSVRKCLFYRGDRSLGPPGTEAEFCFDASDRLIERLARYPNQTD
jgi:hypothetical protein